MKRCSSFIILGILMALCASGFAQFRPCTFQTDISGVAIWMDGATPVISPGMSFAINFYVTQTGITSTNRGDWSSPFKVTGTGLAEVIWAGTPDTSTFNTWVPTAFWSLWDAFRTTYAESWDGNLPDQLSITGIASAYGLGNVTHLKFLNIKASAVTLADNNTPGQICVEQGDMPDNNYDWIFDDTVPTFTKACFPVKQGCRGCFVPDFTNCPTTLTTQHDIPFMYDFDANDLVGDPIIYSIISSPGTIDTSTGVWTWDPPCDSVGKNISLVVCARTSTTSCPSGRECTVNLVVQNAPPVIGGDCGRVFTVCGDPFVTNFTATDANVGDAKTWSVSVDPTPAGTYSIFDGVLTFDPVVYDLDHDFVFTVWVTDCASAYDQCDVTYHILDGGCLGGEADGNQIVNALDVTYLINFLYKSGPAPKPDSLCSGDADRNCLTNILDVTYLINYLYKHGISIGCNICQ